MSLVALLAGFIIVSCSKSTDEPASAPLNVKSSSPVSYFQTPEGNAELAKMAQKIMEKTPAYKGSEFIIPLFTSEGFFLLKNLELDCDVDWLPPGWCLIIGGQAGMFFADYGPKDFWKENPDGTVSVHLSSKNGQGTHIDFGTNVWASGENFNVAINYTGELVEDTYIDYWTGEEVTYYYIDLANSPNAVMMHANGKVQVDGEGPVMNLVGKAVTTPGGQYNTTLNLN